jgi:hypothetical protein
MSGDLAAVVAELERLAALFESVSQSGDDEDAHVALAYRHAARLVSEGHGVERGQEPPPVPAPPPSQCQ